VPAATNMAGRHRREHRPGLGRGLALPRRASLSPPGAARLAGLLLGLGRRAYDTAARERVAAAARAIAPATRGRAAGALREPAAGDDRTRCAALASSPSSRIP
jgi:hypothetical protein